MRVILEGIVTTVNEDGTVNISPMGPLVSLSAKPLPLQSLLLRPYQTSTTFQNLRRTGNGVFHITDDVLLFAQAAVGQPEPLPKLIELVGVLTPIIADTCRWYAFEVEAMDLANERTEITANITLQDRRRDFLGFNRAKHAVIEAAILATRIKFLPANEIQAQMKQLAIIVKKTAGPAETEAFEFLSQYLDTNLPRTP